MSRNDAATVIDGNTNQGLTATMDLIFWALILLGLGFGLIFLELFVPSGGLLGVMAAVLIISGIVVGFISSPYAGAALLLVAAMALPIIIAAFIKLWPRTPIGRRILLGPMTEAEVLPTGGHHDHLRSLVGQTGVARTKMLPSGVVAIDGRTYDATSDGFAIEPGDKIQVVSVGTMRLVVRPVDETELDLPSGSDSDDILSQPIESLGLESLDNLEPPNRSG